MLELRILIIIPSRNGYDDIKRLFKSILLQSSKFDVCVVDSSSIDGTIGVAKSYGANVHMIPVAEFNHGGTRQMMVEKNPDYDIYVFLTQDAYLEDSNSIENIIAPFTDESVAAVCGRQLPHHDATPNAEHARIFNYPAESRIKTFDDIDKLGIKAPFISNSFAAYRRVALQDVGGFPNNVILAEDMYVAAKMLLSGWKVAYAGNACARHSHNYTIWEEFQRYFDTGIFHANEPWIREKFGHSGGEGRRYVISEFSFLGLRRFYLWPSSVFRNLIKLIAYKLGLVEKVIPVFLKKYFSMHKSYWL